MFEDALSPAGYTLPAHASMFTGLYPSEHCTNNENARLDDSYTTIAELLKGAGYRTFLYSANPHIAADPAGNFAQGFEREEHPWSPQWAEQALRIVREKIVPEDRSSELPEVLAAATRGPRRLMPANIKAAGRARQDRHAPVAGGERREPALLRLPQLHGGAPALHPAPAASRAVPLPGGRGSLLPRGPLLDAASGSTPSACATTATTRSQLTRATYDATLLELDELLRDLLEALREAGHLDDTIVILTSDHGEQLGEHHMLDHQYSVYQTVLHVPLVVRAPGRLAPGPRAATGDELRSVSDAARADRSRAAARAPLRMR